MKLSCQLVLKKVPDSSSTFSILTKVNAIFVLTNTVNKYQFYFSIQFPALHKITFMKRNLEIILYLA